MELFKKRLKNTIEAILFAIIVVAICWTIIWLLATLFSWVFGTLIILLFLFGIGYFVNWLFVEPFRKNNRGGKA